MTMLDNALKYARKYGFSVFPLGHRAKTPVVENGFKEATTDPTQIELWWTDKPFANIGIATGEMSGNLAVIDLDIKPDKGIDGDLSLKEWESCHGAFPDTVCATTGSGGRHLYYIVDKPFPCARGIIDGVDIRCNGGYVVAPGSVHANGNTYEWDVSPDDMPIATANSSVYALLEKISTEVNNTTFKSPERIKEGLRTDTLFKLACSLQAKALSDEAIRAAVMTENAEKCEPPLSDAELEKTVFTALSRYPKGEPIKTDTAKSEPTVSPLKIISAIELDTMELPPITFHVNSILADGVTILSAKSKYYKSWLAMQMSIAVATGGLFLGYPTTQSDVIYFDLENDIRVTQDRLRKVSGGAIPSNLYIVNECSRMGNGFEEQIEQVLEAYPKVGLIVIDVLQYVKYNRTSRESDYECDYKTFKYLKSLAFGRPLSIVCIHHNRKMTDDTDPFSNMLGSTALMGATDQEIVIHKKHRNDKDATISITGRTVQSTDLIGYFDTEKYRWVVRGTQEEIFNDERKRQYENDQIVKNIKAILADQNEWRGTAAEFRRCAEINGIRLPQPDNKRLGEAINNQQLIDCLSVFDRINFTKQLIHGKMYYTWGVLHESDTP